MWGNQYRRVFDRLAELDELYLSIQIVSGYTVEQLLQMFLAGCVMNGPECPSVEKINEAPTQVSGHTNTLEAAPDTVVFQDVNAEKPIFNELKDAAAPLLEYLHKYHDPHAYAVVTEGRVEVVRSEIGAPLPVLD